MKTVSATHPLHNLRRKWKRNKEKRKHTNFNYEIISRVFLSPPIRCLYTFSPHAQWIFTLPYFPITIFAFCGFIFWSYETKFFCSFARVGAMLMKSWRSVVVGRCFRIFCVFNANECGERGSWIFGCCVATETHLQILVRQHSLALFVLLMMLIRDVIIWVKKKKIDVEQKGEKS